MQHFFVTVVQGKILNKQTLSLETMSFLSRVTGSAGVSETSLSMTEGEHTWTIRNWKSWLNCSSDANADEMAALYSDIFIVSVDNQDTWWQIKAFPVLQNKGQPAYLAFKLVSRNSANYKVQKQL